MSTPRPAPHGRGVVAPPRRSAGVLAVVAVAAVVAAGCGQSGGGSADGDSGGTDGSGPGSPTAQVVPGTGDDTFPGLGTSAVDVEHYDLELSWDPASAALDARATLTLARTEPGATVPLDFEGLDVERVSVALDGGEAAEADWGETDGRLVVDLGTSVEGGVPIVVTVDYGGSPQAVTSVAPVPIGWLVLDGGAVATPSQPDAAHTWFPCNDHPTDKATYRTSITAPEGMVSVANGVREATSSDGGRATSVWVMDAPMATFAAVVAIADFVERPAGDAAGVPIVDFLDRADSGAFSGALSTQDSMLEFLAERLGPYPFREYGAIVLPGSNVALETQGRSIFFGPAARDRGAVVHELAHQWIGDSVSVTHWGRDLWWSEGFARFAEWLWYEQVEGSGGYADRVALAHSGLGFGDRPALVELTGPELFERTTYDGGALVFATLRAELGDEVFFAAMRTFAERHRHGNATTDDLFAAFEEAAGRDVRPSVEPYLSGGALPPAPVS